VNDDTLNTPEVRSFIESNLQKLRTPEGQARTQFLLEEGMKVVGGDHKLSPALSALMDDVQYRAAIVSVMASYLPENWHEIIDPPDLVMALGYLTAITLVATED